MDSKDSSDQLIKDLKVVIKDAEILLKNSATPLGDEFKSAKERFQATLNNAKDEVIRLERVVVDKAKDAIDTTDNYVKDNPWQAVGLGAAIGLVVGLLIGRK